MKKTVIKIVAALSALLCPILLLLTAAIATPSVYDGTFVGALDEKFNRLTSLDEKKIIIVGGSSAAFGIDSAIIEKYTAMPVVNFGLYAALGTKVMMDLSCANINEGDVVVLAPEIDAQTMSLYFNSETTLMAMDGNFHMARYVRGDNKLSLLGALWKFTGEKLAYLMNGTRPEASGAYDPSYFNAQGDLMYPRPENAMGMYYDPNTIIRLSEDTVDPEFIDYVNEYISFCEKNGASVYFGFCPMNEMALADGTTDESIAQFSEFLADALHCQILGSAEDHILPAEYFYDSNFHLNNAGVTVHTVALVKELLLPLGIPAFVDEEIPEPPALPEKSIRYFGKEDENAQFFTYEMTEFGYRITGLSEAGKTELTLTLPVAYNGYRVALLGPRSLEGGIVETLVIPQSFEQFITETSSSMMTLENNCFAGASSLKELLIYNRHEATIMPPISFEGVAEGFVIHIPEGSSYAEGYFWGERKVHGSKLVFLDDLQINE